METMLTKYVESRGTVGRDELKELFGGDYDIPDYWTLSERYIAGKIAQDLSHSRDKKKRRLILAARCKDGIKYVCVPSCGDAAVLKTIKERIARDIAGQNSSLRTVGLRLRRLSKPSRRKPGRPDKS